MNKVKVYKDEKLDDLLFGELKLIQKKNGYRYSVDALLVSHFALELAKGKVIDLGCGTGVISLILAVRSSAKEILGVEIQAGLAGIAKRNVKLNNLEERIKIIHKDLRKLPFIFKHASFDLVISNPPFLKKGSGKISPCKEKAIAKYELRLKMNELVEIAKYLARGEGSIVFIYPFKRLGELLNCLKAYSVFPYRLKFAYHRKGENLPSFFLIEAKKINHFAVRIQPPYFIETEKGKFHIDRDL